MVGLTTTFPKAQTMVQTATKPRDVAMILINGLDAMLQERRRSTGECG